MTIQELLFRLGVLSKSKAYQPIVYAIELRLSSEGWDPSFEKTSSRKLQKFTPAHTTHSSKTSST